MPSMRIVVDDETWMDGDLGQWEQKQPQRFIDAMKNPRTQPPGLRALMIAMTEGITLGKSLTITLQHTATSWTLTVDET